MVCFHVYGFSFYILFVYYKYSTNFGVLAMYIFFLSVLATPPPKKKIIIIIIIVHLWHRFTPPYRSDIKVNVFIEVFHGKIRLCIHGSFIIHAVLQLIIMNASQYITRCFHSLLDRPFAITALSCYLR